MDDVAVYAKTEDGEVVFPEDANQLPIVTATTSQQRPIISLVDKILDVKKADAEADTSAWEAGIDQLVYELYGLTEEEIKIVEG